MPKLAYSSTDQEEHHPDFRLQWVQDILNRPDVVIIPHQPVKVDQGQWKGKVFNSLINVTLSHETGLRAQVAFRRPCNEPDAVVDDEDCFLLSLGIDLDGLPGRGHGGLTSLLMDQATGTTAVRSRRDEGDDPPATATMTVDYKAPIDTPGVILLRSWATELSGRKVWVKGVIQDGSGNVCAVGKVLFVHPRPKASL